MVLSRTWRPAIVSAAFAALGLAACGGDDDRAADATGPVVVATTGIWADVAGMVACDGAVTVEALVPPGGDPHGYEPSLRDRERLDAATLIVANGGGLEALLDDTLEQVEGGGVPVVRMVDLAGRGDGDRHVWFDPLAVSAALPALGDALVGAGAGRAAIDRCVAAAQTELRELDADVAAALAVVPAERRVLVTNHDSLGAFADRYGFEVLGSVLPSTSTLGEASPSALESLEEEITATGVPAIFAEKLHASTDADALGDRLGVEVVELFTDALGEPGSGADTYPGLLRTDAERIAAALGA